MADTTAHPPADDPQGDHQHSDPHHPTNPDPTCPTAPTASFEELVAEGAAVPTDGWDFSWFAGRATEARPSWGYAVSLAERLAGADAALDVDTGGGEVLDFALGRAPRVPVLLAATEPWPPNVAKATELLRPRGVVVVAVPADAPLPFADGAFDLVTSRHPVRPDWTGIARVLRPGARTSPSTSGRAASSNSSSTSWGPCPGKPAPPGTPTGSGRTRRPPGWRSPSCAPSGCGWSSTTSRPSCTSCAR